MNKNSIATIKNKDASSEYKELINLVKNIDESYDSIKHVIEEKVTSLGLDIDVVEDVIQFQKENINTASDETVDNVYRGFLVAHCNVDDNNYYSDTITIDEIRSLMAELKDYSVVLVKTKRESERLKAESNEIIGEYLDYLSASKLREAKKQKIDEYKASLDTITDEVERSRTEKLINAMESALCFDFLFDRFNQYGEEEIKNVMNSFFDNAKGRYVMQRFLSKFKMYGYNPELANRFFNIEETFLPEEYSVYNNLFLCLFMRIVAFSDQYNRKDNLFVKSVTGALVNLVYHKFDNVEEEEEFKNVIIKVLEKFSAYHDKFEAENTTHKNHPRRIELERTRDLKRKEDIINKFVNMGIDASDIDLDNISADDLQLIYNDRVEDMVNKQREYDNDEKDSEDEELDEEEYDEDDDSDESEDEDDSDEDDLDENDEEDELEERETDEERDSI